MSDAPDGAEQVPEELDADMELHRSRDHRYYELRIYSNYPIDVDGFMAVIEEIAMRYGADPDRLWKAFGNNLPEPGDMS